MFCRKCGAKLSESDQFCPKCGEENINYSLSSHVKKSSTFQIGKIHAGTSNDDSTDSSVKQKAKITKFVTAGACVASVICGALMLFKIPHKSSNKVEYSPKGLRGYIGEETIYFVQKDKVKIFTGKAKSGKSTPDQSKYIVLLETGAIELYEQQETTPAIVCNQAKAVLNVNDNGFFYTEQSNEQLVYYSFSEAEARCLEMENCSYTFSANGNSVAGISDDGELKLFSRGNTSATMLCNAGEDASICCVADDGANVVWAKKTGNTYEIYMLKNGAPERVGKITNSEQYSSIAGFFYNDGNSFLVSSVGGTQLIQYNSGEAKEVALPGVKAYGDFCTREGRYIDSDDDCANELFVLVTRTKSSDIGDLYKLTSEGLLNLEVSGISLNRSLWDPDSSFCLRNEQVYYINEDGDLYFKRLNTEDNAVSITTAVEALYIPDAGEYAYVVKSGSLYYIRLSDSASAYKLNLITNEISDDYSVFTTDKPDTIYYITNEEYIEGAYRSKGTAYQFVVGAEPIELAEDIMFISENDAGSVSAEKPILKQYVSHQDFICKINIGTCVEGQYEELISSVKD